MNSRASAWALSVGREGGGARCLSVVDVRRLVTGDDLHLSSVGEIATNFLNIASGTQQTSFAICAVTVGGSHLGTTVMLTHTAALDPETVSLLSAVLDQAIAALPPPDRSQERKALFASKLLSAASAGERDPVRLRAAALAIGSYGEDLR